MRIINFDRSFTFASLIIIIQYTLKRHLNELSMFNYLVPRTWPSILPRRWFNSICCCCGN